MERSAVDHGARWTTDPLDAVPSANEALRHYRGRVNKGEDDNRKQCGYATS